MKQDPGEFRSADSACLNADGKEENRVSDQIQFKYFYGTESEMLTFYRIPKLLVTSDFFSKVSNDAKVLYSLMLDRMSLSARNHWFDKENRVYIYYSVEDTMENLHCGKNKAMKTIAELDAKGGIGLIERKKQGLGKPDIIYVKNFFLESEKSGSEVYNLNLCRSRNETSRGLQNGPLEVYKGDPNKNKKNNTEFNNTESDLISSGENGEKRSDVAGYTELIKENIEYGCLLERFPYEKDIIDGICDLILEVVLSKRSQIEIARDSYPAELVRSRFLKLEYSHVEYVIERMKDNTARVRNIKKYLLAMLFNAVSMMGSYYQAEVSHDMYYPKAE